MTYAQLTAAARQHGLEILGGFRGGPADGLAADGSTLILLGPGAGFWDHLKSQPEAQDPDPVDAWSTRVIPALAQEFGATPHLPFGGPPYAPFLGWALKTGRCWSSPVGMLVHDSQGLMISFRGALEFAAPLSLPATGPRPCEACADQPCRSACPVSALGTGGYDTDACHGFLDTPAGGDCLTSGCKARRACPVSDGAARKPAQSAHHMRFFHPTR